MATIVYVLCALTSLACMALLMRTYRVTGARLLLWATGCFLGLALNNILLFVDKVVASGVDLSTWRTLPAFLGLTVFALALVWEQGRDRS